MRGCFHLSVGACSRCAVRGSVLRLTDDVDPGAGASEFGSDVDRHLDQSFVRSQLLGHVSAGHRGGQNGARLQGDGRPGPDDLLLGGQAGPGERDKHLPALCGPRTQHAERYEDSGSQTYGHDQVAMTPQQERGALRGKPAAARRRPGGGPG